MSKVITMIDERIEANMKALNDDGLSEKDKSSLLKEIECLHKLRVAELEHLSDDTRFEKWLNRGLDFAGKTLIAIGGWIVYDNLMTKGLEFEKSGSVTSPWIKSLIGKGPK